MRPFDHIKKRLPSGLTQRDPHKRTQKSRRVQVRYQRMRNLGVNRFRYLLSIPVLLLAIVVVVWVKLPPLESARFRPVRYEVTNPLMGWAVPATIEPGTAEVPHTLVHATMTWRELEPVEGEFDFAAFEERNHIEAWRERGARLVLRFVMDDPGSEPHKDIPDWLIEKMGEEPGVYYDASFGSGFSPDYANYALIMAHSSALSAIGQRYDGDPFVAYVEFGSIGHGGEWWVDAEAGVPALPLLQQMRSYFGDYGAAFPGTALLAPNPYQSARLLQAGLYNPFLGDLDRTWDWLDTAFYGGYEPQLGTDLRGMGEFYRAVTSAAQFSRRVSAGGLLTQSLDRFIEQIRESHTTYVSGAPVQELTEEQIANMRLASETMGYRFWIRSAQWQRKASKGESVLVGLTIRNSGVAPMSQSWPVRLVLLNEEGEEQAFRLTHIDTRKLFPGESKASESVDIPIDLPPGEYSIGIEIIDPMTGEPGVEWAMASERHGLISILGKIEVG